MDGRQELKGGFENGGRRRLGGLDVGYADRSWSELMARSSEPGEWRKRRALVLLELAEPEGAHEGGFLA
ncbi:hypothetical protein IEQ34_013410 [Dendrobium chrysotoxum]|uniref:Uncharacterized protein n=1 Tax=Dendrobium chrysotoxum TaxID=161865 RepID=A0AAV7GPE0_DENCH|nr:hypothetical protein IEQ34_013410 [Dendrobium chrysotoxum]